MTGSDLRGRAADITSRVLDVRALDGGRGPDPLGLSPQRAVHGTKRDEVLARAVARIESAWEYGGGDVQVEDADIRLENAKFAVRIVCELLEFHDREGIAIVIHSLAPNLKAVLRPLVCDWRWMEETGETWHLVEAMLAEQGS